jgi:phosphoribosylglycinamide formyltransferase-1
LTISIGILASHEGSTAQAIIERCGNGEIPGHVSVVISNNREATVLDRARASGVDALHLGRATQPVPEELDGAIEQALSSREVDVVVLAGYLRPVGSAVLTAFKGRIVNIHPSLLPRHGGKGMFGQAVHQAVIESGNTTSGATVHLVTEDYDDGPIVAQREVTVLPGDTAEALGDRVRVAERDLLVDTLRKWALGQLPESGQRRKFRTS